MSELAGHSSNHTDEERRRAVAEFAVLGNMAKVSERLGIPHTTLLTWKNSTEWWPKLQAEILEQVEEEILATNLETVRRSQAQLLDRIEHGDVEKRSVKNGSETEIVELRVPVKARDLAIIGSIAQDKARVQLGKPTRISDTSNAMADLAEQFRELARQNQEKVVSEQ